VQLPPLSFSTKQWPEVTRSGAAVVFFIIAVVGILATAILSGFVPQVGPELRAPIALILTASPFVIALMLRHPLFFFAIYAAFVPFENLKLFSGSLTISRFIGLLAAAAIILSFFTRRKVEPVTRPLVIWGALVSWLVMTVMWAISNDYAMLTLTQELQLYMLYSLVALTPVTPKQLRNLMFLIIAAGVLSALYNIKAYSSFTPAPHAVGVAAINRTLAGDAKGDSLEPNNYAASLLIPLMLMLITMLREKRILPKLMTLGFFFTLVFGILTTSSRGAFTAMGVIMTYLLVRSRYRMQIMVAAVGAFIVTLGLPKLWERIFDPSQGDGAGRFQIWSIAADAFKKHYLLGAGVGNFQPAFDESYNAIFQTPRYEVSRTMMSHNLIAGQAVELGIFGLCLMLFAWWTQWRALSDIPVRSKFYDLRIALEALMLGLFTESMFLDTMMRKYIWLAFSLVAMTATVWRNSPERVALRSENTASFEE
jgi:O-antigen ligase